MSTFPTTTPVRDVDSLIRANRAITPKSVEDMRTVKRYSIEEINNTDLDTIRDQIARTRIDDRSPIVKVLDLVDLPRNVVANAIFRPAGVETGKLRRGALGLPVISASDALGELGFKPGLVRGIAGFIGDVALDPLTYVGPPGWGLKVASSAGREVAIGARGARELKRAIEGIRTGKQAASGPEVRALIDTLTQHSGKTFTDAAEHADYLSKKIYGDISVPKSTAGKVADRFHGITGGEKKYQGGLIADALEPQRFFDPAAQEARNVVAKYGKASAPGVSLGGRGSQIAHIPFTEKSISVKPISRGGRSAKSDLDIASSVAARSPADIIPGHVQVAGFANDIHNSINEVSKHFAETEYISSTLPLDQRDAYKASRTVEARQLLEANRLKAQELTRLVERVAADPIQPQSAADIMALQKVKDEAVTKFNALDARAKALPAYTNALKLDTLADDEALAAVDGIHEAMSAWSKYHRAVDGAVGNYMQMNPSETAIVDAAAKFLNTDERMTGRAAISTPASVLKYAGSPSVAQDLLEGGTRRAQNTFGTRGSVLSDGMRAYQHSISADRVRGVQTLETGMFRQIDEAFKAAGIKPTTDDIEQAMSMMTGFSHEVSNTRAGRDIYYTTSFADPTKPDVWLQHLQDAMQSGKFANNTDLINRLRSIAAEYGNDLGEELYNIEEAAGVAAGFREGYLPNAVTDPAREAIARGKRYQNLRNDKPKSFSQQIPEAFQKARSSDQVRFTNAAGQNKRIFKFEEDLAKRLLEDDTIIKSFRDEGRDDIANELDQLLTDYKDYLASTEVEKWHSTSPFEMNQLFKDGRFSLLTDGADLPGGFMHQSLLSAMASRVGSHHMALARESMAKMRNQWAKPFESKKFAQLKPGEDFVAADGTKGKIVDVKRPDGTNDKGFAVGGQIYRRIASDLRADTSNPMISMFGRESVDAIYPKEVADSIERIAEQFKTPESVQSLLKGYDTIIKYWKSVTLMHPAWTIFNMVGDVMNGISNQLPLQHFFKPQNVKFAMQAMKHADNPAELEKLSMIVNGQKITGRDLIEQALSEKVLDGTMMQEAAGQLAANGYMRFASTRPAGRRGFAGMNPRAIQSDYVDTLKNYTLGRQSDTAQKLKAGASVFSDRVAGNFIAPWFRVNQKMSNFMRLNMFQAYLQNGNDVKSAARRVIESQFDYSAATQIEQQVFKRMFPFYSWMRNNGAYQIKKLMESPVYAASYPKVQAAIEEAIAGEDRVPLQQRPNWMRQQLSLQVGKDPDHRFALMFGGALPAADVFQYLTPVLGPEGVQDFLRYFVSGLNPVLGSAIDLGTGRERFSGRTIGAEGDVTPMEYLKNQVRPLSEIGKVGKAFGESFDQGVGRLFLGGRVQNMDAERVSSTKLRELQDRETRLRRMIFKAERDGDSSTSLKGRATLLRLYEQMAELGYEAETPKWARKQLASMTE